MNKHVKMHLIQCKYPFLVFILAAIIPSAQGSFLVSLSQERLLHVLYTRAAFAISSFSLLLSLFLLLTLVFLTVQLAVVSP